MQDVLDIQVTPLSSACGAEIKGVDLTRPLSEARRSRRSRTPGASISCWCSAGQKVSQDDQLRFASYFGDLGSRKKAPEQLRSRDRGHAAGHTKRFCWSPTSRSMAMPIGAFGEGEFWFHIDSGYSPRPYKYTFLYALELPSTGGNTMFSNMYKAYEAVPAGAQGEAQGPEGAAHPRIQSRQAGELIPATSAASRTTAIPLFITHPDTGRKTLFVDRLMTTRHRGHGARRKATRSSTQLYEIGERREFIFEHVWKLGDFLMWDNRCTIHARTDFPKEERRLLRRCTVEGEPLHE